MCLLQLVVNFLGFKSCNTDVSKKNVLKHIFPESENNKRGKKKRPEEKSLLCNFRLEVLVLLQMKELLQSLHM